MDLSLSGLARVALSASAVWTAWFVFTHWHQHRPDRRRLRERLRRLAASPPPKRKQR